MLYNQLSDLDHRQQDFANLAWALKKSLDVPEEWQAMNDPNTQKTYFCNTKTGETTWKVPRQFEAAMKLRMALKEQRQQQMASEGSPPPPPPPAIKDSPASASPKKEAAVKVDP